MLPAPSPGEWWVAITSCIVVGISLSVFVFHVAVPAEVTPFHPDENRHWDLVYWERDRLGGIAKALGAAATAFVSSAVLAVLKDEVAETVPVVWVGAIALGTVGSLITAAVFHRRAGRWARTYAAKIGTLTW